MNMASTAASSRLADIVGASHVVTNPAELAAFEIDGFKPSAVVRPASTEQVAEVVKFAAAEKLALIPTGARTKLAIGLPPRRYDLALDMTRLDRVVAYDPGDLTVSVEAGIPLRALAAALAEHRQFLPLAAPYFNQATIGGTIASGVDGPAAPALRNRARLSSRHGIRHRRRCHSQKRRTRGEKCHRLRHPQIDDRRARNPRRHHPHQFQDLSHARSQPRLRGRFSKMPSAPAT
jgi:hypothetical protein